MTRKALHLMDFSAESEPTPRPAPLERIRYFTPGPVQMADDISAIGGTQVPYFRNAAFSAIMLDCERMMLELAKAEMGSRAVFLTCSGTGGLEAALSSFAKVDQPTLVINTRGFGQRLVDICETIGKPVRQHKLPVGVSFKEGEVVDIDGVGAIACNIHETLTGVRNDIAGLGAAARRSDTIFIADAISSFLCDPIDMAALQIDVLVTGSQKALAVAPGIAVLVLSPRAVSRLESETYRPSSYYFDLRWHLREGARGQTPFTPAISVIYQIHARLKELTAMGVDACVRNTQALALHFRSRLAEKTLPLRVFPDVASNGVTALEVTDTRISADRIVREFDQKYGIFLTPNGGDLKDRVLRVSHMGVQDFEALDALVELLAAHLSDMEKNLT